MCYVLAMHANVTKYVQVCENEITEYQILLLFFDRILCTGPPLYMTQMDIRGHCKKGAFYYIKTADSIAALLTSSVCNQYWACDSIQ